MRVLLVITIIAMILVLSCACPTPRTRCGLAGPEVCSSGTWLLVGRCAEAGAGWSCRVVDAGVAACLP